MTTIKEDGQNEELLTDEDVKSEAPAEEKAPADEKAADSIPDDACICDLPEEEQDK